MWFSLSYSIIFICFYVCSFLYSGDINRNGFLCQTCMLSCIRYMVYPARHIYYMHNTHNPSRSPGPACHYDPHNAVPQGRPPASTLLQKPGTPLSNALSGKAAGRPLQKKRPSRADSLHDACKPFRVPHTSGALTTCPANATTSRRHGKNPAYCLSINSITQAGYKDKKFICNNELPAAHGRISSGRRRTAYFIDRTDSARADIIFLSKKSTRPTSPDSLTETGFRASGTIPGPLFL